MRTRLEYGLNKKDGDILITLYKKNNWLRNLLGIKQKNITSKIPFESIEMLKYNKNINSEVFFIHDITNTY